MNSLHLECTSHCCVSFVPFVSAYLQGQVRWDGPKIKDRRICIWRYLFLLHFAVYRNSLRQKRPSPKFQFLWRHSEASKMKSLIEFLTCSVGLFFSRLFKDIEVFPPPDSIRNRPKLRSHFFYNMDFRKVCRLSGMNTRSLKIWKQGGAGDGLDMKLTSKDIH